MLLPKYVIYVTYKKRGCIKSHFLSHSELVSESRDE